ncbi:MAG: cytochrome c biogenesis protein CcsA [Burkholderiaceae bacterium]|jgi:ABC-type uncharacterized transport system permease subunit|nr:cytochrome c biogenesis protein CcsA [Burkholderiaceae bacterium]
MILDSAFLHSASPVSLLLCAAAALAYAVPALGARALGGTAARRVLLLAWALHGMVIVRGLFYSAVPRFDWAPALSVMVWLAVTVYLIERQVYPQLKMRWTLAGFGCAAIALALVFPGRPLPATSSPWLPLHSSLGVGAYGMFAVAVVHAWLMTRTERQMRHVAAATPSAGLPLLTLERLMFRFVWAGFVLLTLTLLAGAVFGEQLYGSLHTGWRWDHKRVFTALSWLVFAALLAGRSRLGWRGRRAARVLYIGAALLLLGYVGSRFVFEVVLGRAP